MKKIILVVLFSLIFFASSFADAEISKGNQVILSSYYDNSEIWMPTEQETDEALSVIAKHLEVYDKDASLPPGHLKKIRKDFGTYKVQFVGLKGEVNKRILCNFFPADGEYPEWKTSFIRVFDGGFRYWQVEYDVDTKQCHKLMINGDA